LVKEIENDSIIEYILENESAFGILIVISLYGSQNLQNVSKILKKKPNSLIYHVQKLSESNLLEIDVSKINLPGKYYKLTKKSNTLLNDDLTASFIGLEAGIQEILQNKERNLKDLGKFVNLFSGIFSLAKIMANLFVSSIETADVNVRDGQLFKNNLPIGPSQVHIDIVNIEDETDDQKIVMATKNYLTELEKITSEIDKKNSKRKNKIDQSEKFFSDAKRFRFIYNFSAVYNKED
jgi:hypothetical protein